MKEEDLKEVEIPLMMILGGKDQIIDNEEAKSFYQSAVSSSVKKQLITYDDLDHLLI